MRNKNKEDMEINAASSRRYSLFVTGEHRKRSPNAVYDFDIWLSNE